MSKGLKTSAAIFLIASLVWLAWATAILSYRYGTLPFFDEGQGSLEKAGQFGDAFGVLASFMTALAAAAALSAFLRQRHEVASQEFERNFFTLLGNLQIQINETDIKRFAPDDIRSLRRRYEEQDHGYLLLEDHRAFLEPMSVVRGRDAFRALLNRLRRYVGDPTAFCHSKSIHQTYSAFFDQWHDDLAHYFRTLYHIFKMIEDECPGDKMRYARIVRAHLSNSEIILLAYNCAVGEGRHKFRAYLRDYKLLHNYHVSGRQDFYAKEFAFFERVLGSEPFGDQSSEPFKYP